MLKRICLTLFLLAFASAAFADTMIGSLPLVGFGVGLNAGATDLSDATDILALQTLVSTAGLGDYSTIPVATNFGATDLNLANLAGFSFSNSDWGSWHTDSGFIVTRSGDFLNVLLLGTFTPGALNAGFDPTPASLRFTVSDASGSVSEAISLASPPESTPEPASMGLIGLGLIGLAWTRKLIRR